ncbi:hypothetical protein TRVL_00690 [Trypanosoma vivax]|nr:hypothetical protein TRVL_00690 [Trypanosoma vivax]
MSLNPNAVPWKGAERGIDHGLDVGMSQHTDPCYHGMGMYYQSPAMHQMQGAMSHPMAHHGYGQAHHTSSLYSHATSMPFIPSRMRSPGFGSGTMNMTSSHPIPSYRKPNPLVVVVVLGYRRVGKTSVAQRIANKNNYKYISLRPSDGFESSSPEAFVAPLVELLSQKRDFEGIVIDDIVSCNKFEPYYVSSVLQKHKLKFNVAVVLNSELDAKKERGVDYEDVLQRQLHPESYEFCASYLFGETVVVVDCREKSLEDTIEDVLRQLGEVGMTSDTSLQLKEVELIPNCPLVSDPALATEVVRTQNERLSLSPSARFPFSEPNYLLEYPIFARQAFALQSYMVTPWIAGDKVTLIGYRDAVYAYLPMYKILFHFVDCPPLLVQVCTDMKDSSGLGFVFEATVAANKLYITELLLLGSSKGWEMLVNERVDLMKSTLAKLKSDVVQLVPWYPINDVEACGKECEDASGVLFINPDGVLIGEYDSRNYLYPLHRKRAVTLRVWNGKFVGGVWLFDAFCEESGQEKVIAATPVQVSDDDVNTHCINDGNILECVRVDPRGGKGKGQGNGGYFLFQRRCQWSVRPTTVYRQEIFLNDPKWPPIRVAQACASLKYLPAERPATSESHSG